MDGPQETQGFFNIPCACGTRNEVGVQSFGKISVCRECHESFRVIWAFDSRSKKRVPVRLPTSASRASKASHPLKMHPGRLEITCACGQLLLVARHQVGSSVRCPICSQAIKIEKYVDPETQTTRVRRAQPAARDDKPAIPSKTAPLRPERILCSCGETLTVAAKHLGRMVRCPACGTLMRLEKTRDPQTSLTQIRPQVVGRARPPGESVQDTWSLDDFASK
jgi:DNA-directed RNA polymerase subunit M/transcription elongation factor TFIIS